MSYFDQYSPIAAGFANQFNVPQSIAFGLFQQESGWNPNAVGDHGAAIGLGQLHAGAASDVGVNRFDPVQNIKGSLAYLSRQYQKYGNWTDALSAFNQGHAGTNAGLKYANSVLDKAKKLFGGVNIDPSTVANGAACAAGDPMACASAAGSLLGGGSGSGDQCGTFDFVCKLRQWVSQTNFFTRLALASLALLLVLGGLYLMKGNE